MRARGFYEELRGEFPHLPAQPPYVSRPAERRLLRDEGVALARLAAAGHFGRHLRQGVRRLPGRPERPTGSPLLAPG